MRTHQQYLEELEEVLAQERDPKVRYEEALKVYIGRRDDLKIIWNSIRQMMRLAKFNYDHYVRLVEAYRSTKEAHKATWPLIVGVEEQQVDLPEDVCADAIASLMAD